MAVADLVKGPLQQLEQHNGHEHRLLLHKAEGLEQARGCSEEGEQAHLGQDNHLAQQKVLGSVAKLPVPCSTRTSMLRLQAQLYMPLDTLGCNRHATPNSEGAVAYTKHMPMDTLGFYKHAMPSSEGAVAHTLVKNLQRSPKYGQLLRFGCESLTLVHTHTNLRGNVSCPNVNDVIKS